MVKRFPTVLIVEDDPRFMKQIAWEICVTFKRQVQILRAMTYKDAVEIIKQGLAEISIIDFQLPDGHGEDLIIMIREQSHNHPIIVQTIIEDKDYQIKMHNKYGHLYYLTKKILFTEIANYLNRAKIDWDNCEGKRLAIPGQNISSLDVNEVCTVMKSPNGLYVELYDFKQEDYRTIEIKNMGLTQFMDLYNTEDLFVRCHNSYIINKRMIKEIYRSDNEILLLYKRSGDHEVRVPMTDRFKKGVLAKVKGLY